MLNLLNWSEIQFIMKVINGGLILLSLLLIKTSCHQSIINLREGFEIIEFSTMLEAVCWVYFRYLLN